MILVSLNSNFFTKKKFFWSPGEQKIVNENLAVFFCMTYNVKYNNESRFMNLDHPSNLIFAKLFQIMFEN